MDVLGPGIWDNCLQSCCIFVLCLACIYCMSCPVRCIDSVKQFWATVVVQVELVLVTPSFWDKWHVNSSYRNSTTWPLPFCYIGLTRIYLYFYQRPVQCNRSIYQHNQLHHLFYISEHNPYALSWQTMYILKVLDKNDRPGDDGTLRSV